MAVSSKCYSSIGIIIVFLILDTITSNLRYVKKQDGILRNYISTEIHIITVPEFVF